jgi:pimeloyl-ACP methyl ester carboxylesterase
MAKVIAENVKGSKLVAIPKTGHLANMEAANVFNQELQSHTS